MKLKKGDTVKVIAGKDKGKQGSIIAIDRKNNKVKVGKVNIVTKHIKKKQGPGEKIQFEAPINASNVMIICPETQKPTRIGCQISKDGKKLRISKKSGKVLDNPTTK